MLLHAGWPVQVSTIPYESASLVLGLLTASSRWARMQVSPTARDVPPVGVFRLAMFSALDRQVFATWAQRKFRTETRSPRIAIVGTCQSVGVGYSVRLLLPQAAVDIYQVIPGTLVARVTRTEGTVSSA
jgi:hypothetical protein